MHACITIIIIMIVPTFLCGRGFAQQKGGKATARQF